MALPHTSSRTPLRPHPTSHHRPTSSLSLPFTVLTGLHPKRTRNRTALLALLALISVSAYLFCIHYPVSIFPAYRLRRAESAPTEQPVFPHDGTRNLHTAAARKKHKPVTQPPIALSPAQELAAVSGFLASLPQNVIPPSVDPTRPIDPELVLDFDTHGRQAMEEVTRVVADVWARNPVLLYGKLYSPPTRELKALLSEMNLRPPPLFIDVDTRDDSAVLAPMLARLTAAADLPVLLVAGEPVGTLAQIRTLHASGELRRLVTASGAVVGGGKRRKHHKK
ncbi:hypothetical protein B0H15DRAFT_1021316 [Mycena belliarum]|uniref:Uncharacterized protein n=1 Tax=Mycena belliarum TaxID=1033014 RepID=A0AAD6XNU1_9AGAR|nr:hypothetical protein B0H15DRAFT_1021316 [Mycena belliae]